MEPRGVKKETAIICINVGTILSERKVVTIIQGLRNTGERTKK
jgi:translation initiation factor 1 (eIF-1/SUI1)